MSIGHPVVRPSATRDLLTPDDVAAFLRISKTGVYRLVERRAIPFFRVSGVLRFDRADLEAYLRAGRVESMGAQQLQL